MIVFCNMTKHWAKPLLFLLIYVLVTSCDPDRVYDQSYGSGDGGWHSDSIYHYSIGVNDTIGLHDFYINIRNNTDYPYSNIYLFVTTVFPGGHSTRDTIECILADKNGMWLGSGSGKIKDNQIMLQQALRFPLKGIYHFYLEQGMRTPQLKGIEDIGIRIERNTP